MYTNNGGEVNARHPRDKLPRGLEQAISQGFALLEQGVVREMQVLQVIAISFGHEAEDYFTTESRATRCKVLKG